MRALYGMIYLLTTNRPDLNGPCQIKVPSRDSENQPYVGFVSSELGKAYLKYRGITEEEFFLTPASKLGNKIDRTKNIFLFKDKNQFREIDANTEGYEYEEHILENDV